VDVRDVPIEELRRRLDLAGLEVETIEAIGYPEAELPWDPELVITAEVRAVKPHPNADRLVLVDVEYGGEEMEVVVTGAPSLFDRMGESDLHLKVAFAWEGVELYDGHAEGWEKRRLKKARIRGVPSRAMVCSQKELGLSEEAEDILYLPDDTPVGVPLVEVLGDYVVDFDIKGPFGHLQSVYGIAREIAVLYDRPLNTEPMSALERLGMTSVEQPSFIDLEIEDPDLCPRYTATKIEDVEIGPSPLWMQLRLQRAGMRPINNIVDITNYVLWELGQPLHAFDYDWLKPRGETDEKPLIDVRRAREGEQMKTLDKELRTFDDEMLLITDGSGPVAVAGVMGGLDSEVSEGTDDVLLESATFDFISVRRTSQQLKLHTEAASHFGKRVDSELALVAAARAAELMAEIAGGSVVRVAGDLYPGVPHTPTLAYDPALSDRILGMEISREEQVRILTALDFDVDDNAVPWTVTVPSYRLDVSRPIDLVEEIARFWGYDKFPGTLIDEALPPLRRNVSLEWEEKVRDILVGLGLDEVITYSLIDPEDEGRLHPDPEMDLALPGEPVVLRNYLSPDRSQMRRTLLPGALRTAWSNLRYLRRIAIFEIGRIHYKEGKPDVEAGDTGVAYPRHLSLLLTGPRRDPWWGDEGAEPEKLNYFDLKGYVEALLEKLELKEGTEWARGKHPAFHPGRCATVSVGERELGTLGELHPMVREAFDLPEQPVTVLEWDLDALMDVALEAEEAKTIGQISPYAPVHEDLALVVDEDVPAMDVKRAILAGGYPLVRSVRLFDVYRGEQVERGKKSLAFALTYQAPNRSLKERDVKKLRQRILRRLEEDLDAVLRGV
jgi:phenylalanyl-tRNA synthetase beta chain